MSGLILWIVIVAVVVACQNKNKTKAALQQREARPARPIAQTRSAVQTRSSARAQVPQPRM